MSSFRFLGEELISVYEICIMIEADIAHSSGDAGGYKARLQLTSELMPRSIRRRS